MFGSIFRMGVEGRRGEQILLHCQNYPLISLKSQYYSWNNLGYRLYYLGTTLLFFLGYIIIVTIFIPYY